VTFSNAFDNLWKSWRAYAQWRMLYKLRYDQIHKSWGNFLFSRRVVPTSFMKLVASMLGYFSILSTYLWLSPLISSLTCGTLRSWRRMLLVTSRSVDFKIFVLRCLYFYISLEAVPHNWTPNLRIASYNSNLFSIDSRDLLPGIRYILFNWIVFAWWICASSNLVYDRGVVLDI